MEQNMKEKIMSKGGIVLQGTETVRKRSLNFSPVSIDFLMQTHSLQGRHVLHFHFKNYASQAKSDCFH